MEPYSHGSDPWFPDVDNQHAASTYASESDDSFQDMDDLSDYSSGYSSMSDESISDSASSPSEGGSSPVHSPIHYDSDSSSTSAWEKFGSGVVDVKDSIEESGGRSPLDGDGLENWDWASPPSLADEMAVSDLVCGHFPQGANESLNQS